MIKQYTNVFSTSFFNKMYLHTNYTLCSQMYSQKIKFVTGIRNPMYGCNWKIIYNVINNNNLIEYANEFMYNIEYKDLLMIKHY